MQPNRHTAGATARCLDGAKRRFTVREVPGGGGGDSMVGRGAQQQAARVDGREQRRTRHRRQSSGLACRQMGGRLGEEGGVWW